MPPSDVPGERASPTQPFPTRPAPFEYQGVSDDDLADFTPEIRAEAVAAIEGLPASARCSRRRRCRARSSGRASVGGANWGGAAVDPETGMLYVPSRNGFSVDARWRRRTERSTSNLQYVQVAGGRSPRDAERPAALQAALLAPHGHRHEPRRARLDGAGGRGRAHPQSSGAARSRPAAARRRQHVQRAAAHQDAVDLRADHRRHRAAVRGWSATTRPPAANLDRRTCRAPRLARR